MTKLTKLPAVLPSGDESEKIFATLEIGIGNLVKTIKKYQNQKALLIKNHEALKKSKIIKLDQYRKVKYDLVSVNKDLKALEYNLTNMQLKLESFKKPEGTVHEFNRKSNKTTI